MTFWIQRRRFRAPEDLGFVHTIADLPSFASGSADWHAVATQRDVDSFLN
jgi:hypothetical protein